MTTEVMAPTSPPETEQFQAGRVLTLTVGHAVHDTYAAFLSPLLPVFIEALDLSRTAAGLLSVFYQGPSLLQPLIGHFSDQVPAHRVRYWVILAPTVAGVAMSLLGIMPAYSLLALSLTVAGLNSAFLHSIGPVMAGRLSGKSLGQGMGLWMVGGELGRTLGPVVIAATIQWLTLKGTPWLVVGGFLTSILLYGRLRDVPGRPFSREDRPAWHQALRVMRPLLAPLLGIIIVRAFMLAALTTYLPVFLTEEGAALWFAGISLSVLEAAGVVGALWGGSLSDRLGRRTVLLASLILTPALMLAFLAVDGWGRFPLLLLLGFTALSLTPVIMALVQESFPENRALANGAYMALSFGLRSGAVVVLGAIGDFWGMRTAFTVSAMIPVIGLPFLFLLPRSQR
ncbi:MAG: MFS transporter [Anaerolineae bacterium]